MGALRQRRRREKKEQEFAGKPQVKEGCRLWSGNQGVCKPEATDEQAACIVASPDKRDRVKGSKKARCADCKHPVWIAPAAQATPAATSTTGAWEYMLKDGRGPYDTVQAAMDALGLDKATRP